MDVLEPQEEARVLWASDLMVRLNNFLDFYIYEIIKGVDMLFYETPNFQEFRDEFPLFLYLG